MSFREYNSGFVAGLRWVERWASAAWGILARLDALCRRRPGRQWADWFGGPRTLSDLAERLYAALDTGRDTDESALRTFVRASCGGDAPHTVGPEFAYGFACGALVAHRSARRPGTASAQRAKPSRN
jgi:hypothetical protein